MGADFRDRLEPAVLALLIIADLTIGALVRVHIPNDAPRKIEGLRVHRVADDEMNALRLEERLTVVMLRAINSVPAIPSCP